MIVAVLPMFQTDLSKVESWELATYYVVKVQNYIPFKQENQ